MIISTEDILIEWNVDFSSLSCFFSNLGRIFLDLERGLTHHLFENPALPVCNYGSHVWNYFEVLRLLQSLIIKDVDNLGKPNYLHLKAEVGQIFI